MIGSLRGLLLSRDPPHLLVEVAGIGYEVEVPASTWASLPAPGSEVQLRTHLVVREDQHLLYGFASEAERALFRDLIKVSGIGARIALAILSSLSVEDFMRCVQARDTATLTRVPGIGRKTAERLFLDLHDRIETLAAGMATAMLPPATAEAEAMGALQALGYRPAEARRLIDQAQQAGADTTADILRAALRAAMPGGRG